MRIVIPIDDNNISSRFDESVEFRIYEAEDEIVVDTWDFIYLEKLEESIFKAFTKAHINTIICDYMSMESKTAFSTMGYEIITDVKGEPNEAIIKYLSGEKIGVMDIPNSDIAFTDTIDMGVYRKRSKFKLGGFRKGF